MIVELPRNLMISVAGSCMQQLSSCWQEKADDRDWDKAARYAKALATVAEELARDKEAGP